MNGFFVEHRAEAPLRNTEGRPGNCTHLEPSMSAPPLHGGGRLAAALAMFLRRSQCTRAATRPLSHSATQPIRCSATRPISHLDSAAMAGIIFYSADQKWQPWSPQNNQISCGYGGGFRTLDLKPPGAVRRCDGAVRVRASLHCGATNAMDFRGPDVCALRQVALPSNVCAPIAAGVAVRRCDGATVRRCAVRGARATTLWRLKIHRF